jgi:hypothetical protein
MAGSIRVLWPWPDGVESTVLGTPEGEVLAAVAAAVVAFVLVIIVAGAAQRVEADEEAALTEVPALPPS